MSLDTHRALEFTAAAVLGLVPLGLSVTGNLIDLLVCLCLFWILIKIPFWAKDLAFSPGRSGVAQIARRYVLAKGAAAL